MHSVKLSVLWMPQVCSFKASHWYFHCSSVGQAFVYKSNLCFSQKFFQLKGAGTNDLRLHGQWKFTCY